MLSELFAKLEEVKAMYTKVEMLYLTAKNRSQKERAFKEVLDMLSLERDSISNQIQVLLSVPLETH